jgi:[ribosomal protein S18]-alanine N-acetyltransferase
MMQPSSAGQISILWALPEHAAELAALHAPLFDVPWDAAAFRELLNNPGALSFLARAGHPAGTVGFVIGRVAADEAEVLSLGVCQGRQRTGVGRRLLEAACRAARKAEARKLYLEVAADNAAAVGLYKALGFEEVGRRKGYYQRSAGPAEDAINFAIAL